MNGEHILHNQARGVGRRVDHLLILYSYACFGFFVVATISAIVLIWFGFIPSAINLFVLSIAITGYAYSTLLQRRQHIKDITDKSIDLLRSRWDELRKDQDLLKFFTNITTTSEIDETIKLKVRFYISTVLDMYALILHYINHGYFDNIQRFSVIYECMIKSFFRYPHMCEIWYSRDTWGNGCLREEYGESLKFVVDKIIEEIREDNIR